MSDLLFIDVETTGLNPEKHRIWEVAIVGLHGGPVLDTQIRLDKYFIRDAEEDALRIGRFHSRYNPNDATPPSIVAHTIAGMTEGHVLAGFNPWFDANFLRALLHDHDLAPAWDYRLLDVTTYAAGRLNLEVPNSSRKLCEAYGIPATDDLHTAVGDASRARTLYKLAQEGLSLEEAQEYDEYEGEAP